MAEKPPEANFDEVFAKLQPGGVAKPRPKPTPELEPPPSSESPPELELPPAPGSAPETAAAPRPGPVAIPPPIRPMAEIPSEDRPSMTNVHAGPSEGASLLLKAVSGDRGGKSEDEITHHAANLVMAIILVSIIMSLLHFCQYYAEKRQHEASTVNILERTPTPEPADLDTF